jgi:choloylglycine hydrolase
MGKSRFFGTAILIVISLVITNPAWACTDFQIKASDGSVVIGRSMEFALDLKSEIVTVSRGQEIVSTTPEGNRGLAWTSKYGFLGVNVLGRKDYIVDGMNEAGLAVEALWFPESKYPEAKDANFVVVTDFGRWLLGNQT